MALLGGELWDEYRIKLVIDIRNLWKDGKTSHGVPVYDNVRFDPHGGRILRFGYGRETHDGQWRFRTRPEHAQKGVSARWPPFGFSLDEPNSYT